MKTTALFLALALAAFGCNALSDHAADDAAADVIDNAGKADGVDRPVGTYDLQGESNDAYLDMLVLKTDGTFVWSRGLTDTYGTYKFTRNNAGTTYIRCTSTDGEQLERLAYTLEGTVLNLRWANSNVSFTMEQGLGWCDQPADCGLQGLTYDRCMGGAWECFSKVCDFQCPPTGENPCVERGGTCVDFAPDACADGIPTTDSCGSSRSLSCCLPQSACTPVCQAVGSQNEGWYNPCTGELICWAGCADQTATCGAVGSRSEGWYSTGGTGCNGIDLIGWAHCSQ